MTDPKNVASASDLVDLCQEWWGVTGYNELVSPTPPWWRVRQIEAGKLNSLMKRRNVRLDQLVDAAEFCRFEGIRLRQPTDLFKHVTAAMVAKRAALQQARLAETERLRETAIGDAIAAGEDVWVERLVRASGPNVADVVKHWQERADG